MSERTISNLRSKMFDMLDELSTSSNEELDAKIRKAESMSKVAQVIVNATLVEVKHAEVFGGSISGVVDALPNKPTTPIGSVTRHII